MITIDQERPQDSAGIEALLDAAFGPERALKSSYKLREHAEPLRALCSVLRVNGALAATVRFSQIHVRDTLTGAATDCLLLGPLAVDPAYQTYGFGSRLMRRAMEKVSMQGYGTVLLVGDVEYYQRFGFERVSPRFITMPDGRDADRLLVWQSEGQPGLPFVGSVCPNWVLEDQGLVYGPAVA